MSDYQVAIVGAGPVGLALGIELGMFGIRTVIYEKHPASLWLPRAQLLNPRSMEFFRRWGINEELISKKLLPEDFPIQSVWCTGMAGNVYETVNLAEIFHDGLSPEKYHRIPLWITEEVLRQRLKKFKCVQLIVGTEVTTISEQAKKVIINSSTSAEYVVGCDGANSLVRQTANIKMQRKLAKQKMISLLFQSKQLKEKMTVPKGVLYYNLSLKKPAAIGCIDYKNGLWYAQIPYSDNKELSQLDLSAMIDHVAGINFQKKIKQANFWLMQTSLAVTYRNKRLLIAGDAAHILPPTGGHNLNTGFGDVVNLGWKLAAVIKNQGSDRLLDTYDIERCSVAKRNSRISSKNVKDLHHIKNAAKDSQQLARQHSISLGIALGYCYQSSPIIYSPAKKFRSSLRYYKPRAEAGFFAPHCLLRNKNIYDYFSPCYILLSRNKMTKGIEEVFNKRKIPLQILELAMDEINEMYPKNFYLLRPDWHIAWLGDNLPKNLCHFIDNLGYLPFTGEIRAKKNYTPISGR